MVGFVALLGFRVFWIELRGLMRYRSKLTNIMTSEKNRALNCLTVSNLKLDDVFSDVFGKSKSCEHPVHSSFCGKS